MTSFLTHFGNSGEQIYHYFAPGRINLIGEHIDYNGGWVMPFAISRGIHATVRFAAPRSDGSFLLRFRSQQAEGELYIDSQDPQAFERRLLSWMNYPLGIVSALHKDWGLALPCADVFFDSDLPMQSGLSSSAAMEALTLYLFLHHLDHPFSEDRTRLALFCQQVERQFVGVNCGIMDQFAVLQGRRGHVLLLHCDTLQCEYVPFVPEGFAILAFNTNKPRALVESKYNERRSECEAALQLIQSHGRTINNLCDANIDDLAYIERAVLRSRALHVIGENERVQGAAIEILKKNWAKTGKLLSKSHDSLSKNYEVTGYELDLLVGLLRQTKGCIGERMTGAGFGGCAIALVERSAVDECKNSVKLMYDKITGLSLDAFEVSPSDGVRFLGVYE